MQDLVDVRPLNAGKKTLVMYADPVFVQGAQFM